MKSSITHTIDGKYIREWLILGPFFPDDLEKDFLTDVGGEANIQPKEGDTVTTADGRMLTWKRYESEKDAVNLLDAVGDHEYATAYALKTSFDWTPDKPGAYTFEVQAIDRDLNYSKPASVKLEVIPDPRNHRIIQLEEHIRQQELAEMERIHKELEDARQIQQSLLPDKPPDIEGFEIAGTSIPAREVGGDFYSYLSLGKNTGIILADVTGKSVKAAMVAAMTNGMLNSMVNSQQALWDSPRRIFRELNAGLRPHLLRGMYTAMSLGIICAQNAEASFSTPKGKLLISNAGMPYPVIKRGKDVWELKVNGVPLGIMRDAGYEDMSFDMEAGDFVVFCSDGVIEAENGAEEMYQAERLLEVIQQADTHLPAQAMLDWIVKDIRAYVGDVEQTDDITIVVLRCINLYPQIRGH